MSTQPSDSVIVFAFVLAALLACKQGSDAAPSGVGGSVSKEIASSPSPPALPPAQRSAMPTSREWDGVGEVLVRGSTALSCSTKMVREWLRIACTGKNDTGGTPTTVELIRGADGAVVSNSGGVTSLVFPFVDGADVEAIFSWTDKSHRFTSRWPLGTAMPQAKGEFVGAPRPGPFVRRRPDVRQGVDACAYLGGVGMDCLNALLEEKDSTKQRHMRRLSDAAARIELEARRKGAWSGVAHAELALDCAESGPCKQKRGGTSLDDGYACLTKAEAALADKRADAAKRAHERACECDPVRAQIPVMGGVLACDGPNRPVERGHDMELGEAKDVRACAECDARTGDAACGREIHRLRSKDPAVGRYVETVHVPRCRQP